MTQIEPYILLIKFLFEFLLKKTFKKQFVIYNNKTNNATMLCNDMYL